MVGLTRGALMITRSEQFAIGKPSGTTQATPTPPERTTTMSPGLREDFCNLAWKSGEMYFSPAGSKRFWRTFCERRNGIPWAKYSLFIGPTWPTVTRSAIASKVDQHHPCGRTGSSSQFGSAGALYFILALLSSLLLCRMRCNSCAPASMRALRGGSEFGFGGDEAAFDGGFEDGGLVALEVGLDALEVGDGFVEAGELLFDFGDDAALLVKSTGISESGSGEICSKSTRDRVACT